MYIYRNPNPCGKVVGDCVVRGLSILLDLPWDRVYEELTKLGQEMCDMPSSIEVWSEYLYLKGYSRFVIPDSCPYCYSVKDFCRDYPDGEYLLAIGSHVVAVIDGDYYDAWDSGNETPIYYYKRRNS